MAFIFGSYAKEDQNPESDIDVAVYFTPTGKKLEWEEDKTIAMKILYGMILKKSPELKPTS